MKLSYLLNSIVESEIKRGKKKITIVCNDSDEELEKLLKWWKSMGDIGQSALIHCDVDNKSNIVKVYCDGDDRVLSITVKMLPEDNK